MRIDRWPRRAAMASRLMPRLMAWVARVWRSWWGWTWPTPSRSVVADELDEQRVQGHVAGVVQLAHRDAQPEGVADADHGVVVEVAQLAHAHAGAGQQLDHEAPPAVGIGGQRGHELGRGGVVQKTREGVVGSRKVVAVDGD